MKEASVEEDQGWQSEKVWRCEHDKNHILGQVRRNGKGIRQLMLYRLAVDLGAEQPEEVDVMAIVEGYVTDVKCSICGFTRTWMPGQEALARLLKQAERSRTVSSNSVRQR